MQSLASWHLGLTRPKALPLSGTSYHLRVISDARRNPSSLQLYYLDYSSQATFYVSAKPSVVFKSHWGTWFFLSQEHIIFVRFVMLGWTPPAFSSTIQTTVLRQPSLSQQNLAQSLSLTGAQRSFILRNMLSSSSDQLYQDGHLQPSARISSVQFVHALLHLSRIQRSSKV